ncbi:myosin-13 isoform X2 [Teleopsis dalmanni]|uniref:myosin-13 isoform X2 n=1 Tax=Teleopsis dalmanni TaxID=139649 RepID=UPI0018CE370A|nr:myosin-13 isoform X2 [Teleopsis dalmanni]
MVIDIKMCRFDNVPWGFRLVGGSDFEHPLTVVKVNEGGVAEEAGLKAGDVIVRINDIAATPLTHDEVNKIITKCGNVFFFGVYRENEEPEDIPKHFPVKDTERSATPESLVDANSIGKSPIPNEHLDELKQEECECSERSCSVLSENTERILVEEEIAAVLSGESEVLKEHNIMGIFPKPGVCMTSAVLKTLNEEAIKTKAEKDKENKKWTTFLQKPDRPIPKSRQQLEAERRAANAYKVKIVKSQPRSERDSVSPFVQKETDMPTNATQNTDTTNAEETMAESSQNETVSDVLENVAQPAEEIDVPNLEALQIDTNNTADETNEDDVDDDKATDEEKIDKEKEASPENKETIDDNKYAEVEINAEKYENEQSTYAAVPKTENTENTEKIEIEKFEKIEKIEKTEEELALEQQLASVQKQLAALSSLPSTIQATLDAVTKQLAELLPTFKLQEIKPLKVENVPREISLEKIEEVAETAEDNKTERRADVQDAIESNESVELKSVDNEVPIENKQNDSLNNKCNIAEERDKKMEESQVESRKAQQMVEQKEQMAEMDETQNLKKQKRHEVIEELEEHWERKSNPKRSKRAFGPLTPSSERPLVLPGGRRWYRPKDAYNDEFIAETLSAQAELITGTTLGVNFMKYQKPERKIDLNRSEVYKVIHHLDRQPIRGIEVRPPMVAAEVDVRKAVH